MIQALVGVTGRFWAKRRRKMLEQSVDVEAVSPTQKSHNIWQAGKRLIPKESITWRSEMHEDEAVAKVVYGRTDEGLNVRENCRVCDVV